MERISSGAHRWQGGAEANHLAAAQLRQLMLLSQARLEEQARISEKLFVVGSQSSKPLVHI